MRSLYYVFLDQHRPCRSHNSLIAYDDPDDDPDESLSSFLGFVSFCLFLCLSSSFSSSSFEFEFQVRVSSSSFEFEFRV